MFQIKNFNSILASMINNVNALSDELTDFNIGSKNRTILEATARELDHFYQNLLKGIYEAVPVSIYKSFAFGRLPAAAASGYVTFTRDPETTVNITIPAGTQIKVPNTDIVYATQAEATILEGQDTVDVFVVATSPGESRNAAANTITELVKAIDGITTLTNANGFSNGANEEDDYNRRLRFRQYVNNLSRATRFSVIYGARTAQIEDDNGIVTERVVKCLVHEPCIDDDPPGAPGYINVYVWNGVDGASNELCSQVRKVLHGYTDGDGNPVPGWKGAGVIAYVRPVETDPVDVTVQIEPAEGFIFADLEAPVGEAIDSVFEALDIGGKLIVTHLIDAAMDVPGVNDIAISAPAGNVTASEWNRVIVKGTMTISEMGN